MLRPLKVFIFLSLILTSLNAQVNRVGNPSFENYISCFNLINSTYYWNSIDSAYTGAAGEYSNACWPLVPSNAGGFQNARTGKAYIRSTLYCVCPYPNQRNYVKNRLLSNLINGKTYCAKVHVNLTNTSPQAIDGIGMYFSDISIDTTKYQMIPLSYLTPQVQNPSGNVIGDTLNWIEVSGTFVATGIEKYVVIGNFRTDAATTKTTTGVFAPFNWAEYYIDDVSVIDFNLSAFAGLIKI